MSNSANMPVCTVSPASQLPTGNAVLLPSIPVATDLMSALNAINAMRQWMMNFQFPQFQPQNFPYFNGVTQPNKGTQTSPPPPSNPKNSPQNPPNKTANYTENRAKRTTQKVKVTNPDDPSQYVMVEQITGLTFTNGQGNEITWSQ